MNNKKLMLAITMVFVLVMGYTAFLEKVVYPKHPEWRTQEIKNPTPEEKQPLATATNPSTVPSTTRSTTMADQTGPSVGPATIPAGQLQVAGATTKPTAITLGSKIADDPNYPIALDLTPEGAGINMVTINGYKAVDNVKVPYFYQLPYPGNTDTVALATRKFIINGQTLDVGNDDWSLEASSLESATYGLHIDNAAGAPVLHITKTYSIKSSKDPSAGYEVSVAYHVQNLTAQQQTVRIVFNGPTEPPKEVERGVDRQMISAFDKGNDSIQLDRHGVEEFKKDHETIDLKKNDKNYKFLWAGASGAYFESIVRPIQPESIDKVEGKVINLGAIPTPDADEHQVLLTFETTDFKLDQHATKDIPFEVYFGPKVRTLLEDAYYSAGPRYYKDTLVTNSGWPCGVCTFPLLIDGLIGLLRFFHNWITFHDWGLAIILLVVLVRLCLHPITKASQVSMVKMQKLSPEVERLKKKFGDDKDGFAKAQMQLYKEFGFTPILGCLPMFLQMPIWIALYAALQGEIALRQAPFLWGWTWIHDLARPDRLWAFDAHAFTIPLVGMKIASLNILPLILAVVFFLQQKYTPKPPAATPEQAQQQKMMQWMSLLFPVFLYTAPSGLNLYIATSTTIGIIESKRIRDHIKQRQEAEKSDKVIVDAGPTRAGKQNKKEEKKRKAGEDAKKAANAGGLKGWWANLQRKAEEYRKEAERNKKKNS